MTAPRLNGCHNRDQFAATVQIGAEQALQDGRLVALPVVIPNFSAVDSRCQYTKSVLGRVDVGCIGCGWRLS